MPRQLATGRVLAVGRVPAVGRKPIGFINDGKIHVVLDTNVIIDALEGMKEGSAAIPLKKACVIIIETWEKDKFTVGINGYIMTEYSRVVEKKLKEGKVHSNDINKVLGLAQKSISVRVSIDQQRKSPHQNDDILFDGLAADYLVSSNMKNVRPDRLLSLSTYKNTLKPDEFVIELEKLGLY